MTDTLRHTVPVPLPRTQESGVAPVHGTGGSATPQTAAPAGDSVPHRHAGMPATPPGDSPAARTLQAQSPTDSTENTAAGDTLAADSAADGEFPFSPSATRSRSCRQRPGTTSRPRRSSARHPCWFRSSRYIPPGRSRSPKIPFSRVSCCCWPQPMPCSSTAIWRMCACC